MLFTNANLFLDGCFQRGAFRAENAADIRLSDRARA